MEILSAPPLMQPIFVARQAIYDRDGAIYGHKLLFRHSEHADTAQFDDADQATAQIIADGFALAQQGLKKPLPMCITMPRNLLRKETILALPPERIIVQVQDPEIPDRAVLNACIRLKELGFRLAVAIPSYAALIQIADIVSMDLRGRADADVIKVLQKLSQFSGLRMAEKVEDKATWQMAKSAGFQLFQGYFFSVPKIIPGRKMQAAAAAKIRLIQEISKDDYDVQALSRIIATEPSLSLRLLTFINSVAFAQATRVDSIPQAVVLLGQQPLKQWLMAVLLADLNQQHDMEDSYFIAVQRAKFFELLAESTALPPLGKEAMMLVGLFSRLDVMLGMDMESILADCPLDDAVKDALLLKHPASQWIALSEAVEEGSWDAMQETLATFGLSPVKAAVAYNKASVWAGEMLAAEHGASH